MCVIENLSEKTPNFRELSIEALDSDFDMAAFLDLLKKLKLTTLRCINLYHPRSLFESPQANHHVNAKLLKACSQNEFMRNNLNYLDFFPMLLSTNSEAKLISKLLVLKKIALFYINEDRSESLYEDVTPLQGILEQNLYLQEMELFFGDNDFFIFERDMFHISKAKLLRFSILGNNKKCQEAMYLVFKIGDQKNLSEWIKSAKSIHVSWLQGFKSQNSDLYNCYIRNKQHMFSWILFIDEGKFVKDTQLQKKLCGMYNVDYTHKTNPLISRYLSVN